MGQFTSYCKNCYAKIHWFLTAPDNYICKCGTHCTHDEIKLSWDMESFFHTKRLEEELNMFKETHASMLKTMEMMDEVIRLTGIKEEDVPPDHKFHYALTMRICYIKHMDKIRNGRLKQKN